MSRDELTIKLEQGNAADVLVFVGPLTETSEASLDQTVLPKGLKKDLVLDLKGIKHVNSYGVRDWIDFMKRMEKQHSLTIRGCSPTFIMSANILPGMLGKAHVESVNRGYQCPSQHYWWVEVKTEGLDAQVVDRTKPGCEKCGQKAKPEYGAEEYFSFLES